MTVAQLIERLRALPPDLPACFEDGQLGGVVARSVRMGEAYVSGKLAPAVLIGDEDEEGSPRAAAGELATLL